MEEIESLNAPFKQNGKPADEDIDHGFFRSWGGKQPPRINFVMGVQQRSCRWQLSSDILYDGSTIIIPFVSCTVIIAGKGLDELHDLLHRERVACVRMADNPVGQRYVESITIKEPVDFIKSIGEFTRAGE